MAVKHHGGLRSAVAGALIFLVFGLLWITLSDHALLLLVGGDLARYAVLQTWKGVLFVVLTTALVFILLAGALRRQARDAATIRQSQSRYERLIANLTVGVYHANGSGDVVFLNDQALSIIGMPRDAALGTGWLSAIAAADRERVGEHVRQAVSQGQLFYEEFRFEHADGRTVHVVSVGRPELDDSGHVTGYIGTLTDVSAIEQATASLRESEHRLQTFMDSNPAIVWIKDRQGRYAYMNRAWETAFGLAAVDIVGHTAETLVGATEARRVAAIDATVIAQGAANGTVEDFIDVQGRRHVWETVRFPFSTADGAPCIGGIAIDRSDRHQAEETLRELQERLNLATAAGNIGLWEWHLRERRAFYSAECKRQLGFDDDEVGDSYAEWEARVHPDDLPRTKRRLRATVRHPDIPYVSEQRMLHKDGKYRWILAHGRMQTDADGRPLRLLGAHTDITAVKEAEQALVATQARLNHLLSANPSVLYLLRVTDSGLVPEWISDSVTRLLGYTTAEALAPHWWTSHIHPADRDRCLADSANITRHEHFVHEYRFLHRNGEVLVVRDEMRVLRDADGVPREIVGSWSDITSASTAQARMRLFGTAFESTQEAVLITDQNSTIVSVNRAACEITGYTEAELVGRNPRLLRSKRHDRAYFEAVWAELARNDHWQGEIWNRRKDGSIYPQLTTISVVRDEAGRIVNHVSVGTDISRLKQAEHELHRLAHYDALTALPNRLLVLSRLEHAIARSQRDGFRIGVMFIDLDDFKKINDGLGHSAGDELLKAAAARLAKRVRREDTLGRLGGDEFLVLLERVTGPATIAGVARDLARSLAAPLTLPNGHEVHIDASIGISVYPDDADNAEGLLRAADTAMYEAKATAGEHIRFFTADMGVTAAAHLELEIALRAGIANDELQLFYQPKFDIADGGLVGAEALLRWQRSDGRLEAPARFIPVAERTGLIGPLGTWVIDAACRQQRAWLDAGLRVRPVAVNVSVQQFSLMDLRAEITAALERHGLAAPMLGLEITESAAMADPEQAIAVLGPIQRNGHSIDLDDFGTGFSNLAYLTRLPLDVLKIDASFVREIGDNPQADSLVGSVIALAHGLGLRTIAEGVETERQLEFLREHGCDQVQGYLLGRPLPAHEYDALLRKYTGSESIEDVKGEG